MTTTIFTAISGLQCPYALSTSSPSRRSLVRMARQVFNFQPNLIFSSGFANQLFYHAIPIYVMLRMAT